MAVVLPMVGSAVTILIKFLEWDRIQEQFKYVFCYTSNLRKLEDEGNQLDAKRKSMQFELEEAGRSIRIIGPDVDDWITRVDANNQQREALRSLMEILQQGSCNGLCPNPKLRYSVTKKARKLRKAIKDLNSSCPGVPQISHAGPPLRNQAISLDPGLAEEFDSRNSIEEEIMEALGDESISLIGICGMGGVGKTRMAERIVKRVENQKLFLVLFAVVGQNPKVEKIQSDIAVGLGLKFDKQDNALIRANKLRARLGQGSSRLPADEARVLIILDNVWEFRDLLKNIGISPHNSCKIIITCRDMTSMRKEIEVQKIFPVPLLKEEEAWNLFRRNAGTCIESSNLESLARNVAKECGNLPLALIAVGRSMRDEGRKGSWEDALRQLRASALQEDMIIEPVYRALQLSYNNLKSQQAKDLFLICCLFPEGSSISHESLVNYGLSLQIFSREIRNVRAARDRVSRLLDTLKGCFLVMDASYNSIIHKTFADFSFANLRQSGIYLHDVVRDVGISIASKLDHAFVITHEDESMEWGPKVSSDQHYTCMSIINNKMTSLPGDLEYPNLELLAIGAPLCDEFPPDFFSGMKKLRVLTIIDMTVQEFPRSISSLVNLQSLNLSRCELGDISIIGKLTSLKFLVFGQSNIKVLPEAIGGLTNLKLLDLSGCSFLEFIAPGVLQGLSRLEDLQITESKMAEVVSEEAKESGNKREKTTLPELNNLVLKNLRSLTAFCKLSRDEVDDDHEPCPSSSHLMLKHSNNSMMSNHPPQENNKILSGNGPLFDNKVPLGNLKSLTLFGLDRVTEIFGNQHPASFFNGLEVLRVISCQSLKYMFSFSSAKSLVSLEALMVARCRQLKSVILDHDIDEDTALFPQLQLLQLSALSSLQVFCSANVMMQFPSLENVDIRECPELKPSSLEFLRASKLKSVHAGSLHLVRALHGLFSGEVEGNSKTHSMMVPASDLSFKWGQDSRYWEWHLVKESSGEEFQVIAELKEVCRLRIEGKLRTGDLSSATKYEILFLIKLDQEKSIHGWERPVSLELILPDGTTEKRAENFSEKPREKWMEISAGEFTTPNHDSSGDSSISEIRFALYEYSGHLKHGLSTKGVLLRPKSQVSGANLGNSSLSLPTLNHSGEAKFQINQGNLSNNIPDLLPERTRETEAEFRGKLSNQQLFLSPAELSIEWVNDSQYWEWETIEDSRSGEEYRVAKLNQVSWMDIKGKLKTSTLLLGTEYEVLFLIKLDPQIPTREWEIPVYVDLVLPDGTTKDRVECLSEKPRGEWINIFAGTFTISSTDDDLKEVTFCMYEHGRHWKRGLCIKGVLVQPTSSTDRSSEASSFRFLRSLNNHCFLFPSTRLAIQWSQDSQYWTWHKLKESSGSEEVDVAKLKKVYWLDIQGRFRTLELCAETKYEVFFIVMLEKEPAAPEGWELPVCLELIRPDGTKSNSTEDLSQKPKGEWLELPVGEFTTVTADHTLQDRKSEVEFSLYEHGGHVKKGLSIKGALFRPTNP